MRVIEQYLHMSPDGYSRYFFTLRVIEELLQDRAESEVITILDVGGHGSWLPDFLDEAKIPYRLTILDILPQEKHDSRYAYVQGSALKMPFTNESFDLVTSTDTLEHIPDEGKKTMITECLRVAADTTFLSAPFASEIVDQAEHMANSYYHELTGKNHHWLEEHFQLNKPEISLMESTLNEHGYSWFTFESNAIANWLETVTLNFLAEIRPEMSERVGSLNKFYNKHLLQIGDLQQPGYRRHYLVRKKNTQAARIGKRVANARIEQRCVLEWQMKKTTMVKDLETMLIAYQGTVSQLLNRFERFINDTLDRERESLKELESMRDAITKSRFYKIWQKYAGIKRSLGIKPRLE